MTVEEPTSFIVECHNEQHSINITVSSEISNTQLGGLASISYNCCVSAIYPLYVAKQICTIVLISLSTLQMKAQLHPRVTTSQGHQTQQP